MDFAGNSQVNRTIRVEKNTIFAREARQPVVQKMFRQARRCSVCIRNNPVSSVKLDDYRAMIFSLVALKSSFHPEVASLRVGC